MRVYLIAAPEDEAEAEKLAEYLKRYGVFIRAEYGRMSYPPAHTGEYTLALWSRNAMMSSRQMMLTNRAIDAWENGQLVMARLEHGLNPRGLGDLEMVDLTFPAARQHRYHDVLNALRAMEDARRAALREQAEAEAERSAASMMSAGNADLAMSAPMESAADMAPPPQAAKRRAESAPASMSAPAKSRGSAGIWLGLLALIVAGGGIGFWVFGGPGVDRRAMQEPVSQVPVMPEPIMEEPVAQAEEDPDRSPASVGDLEPDESDAFGETPPQRPEFRILEVENEETPPPAEPGLLDHLQQLNGPVLWAAATGLVGLVLFMLLLGRRKRPKSAEPIVQEAPQPSAEPSMPADPIAPPPVLPDGGHDAFVSYSHANAEMVLPIVQSIEEDGITVWIDRDEMRAGQNWAGQIVRAIKSADRFCLMCSAQAFESDHVRREVYLADKYGKKMVPIRLDATEMPEDIEYFLIGRQWIDLFEVAEEDRMQAIKTLLSESDN